MMMEGLNVNAGGELGTILRLSPEQLDIPPANAVIGGVSYGSAGITIRPSVSLVVAGVVIAGIAPFGRTAGEQHWPTLDVTIAPVMPALNDHDVDIKTAYEKLRQQMAAEGIPFLNAAELEREIADRKGTRS